MDTGVANVVDDKYATSVSEIMQVSTQYSAKWILNIGLFVCVCVCVLGFGTSWNSISSMLLELF